MPSPRARTLPPIFGWVRAWASAPLVHLPVFRLLLIRETTQNVRFAVTNTITLTMSSARNLRPGVS